jgi:hypothetical protein
MRISSTILFILIPVLCFAADKNNEGWVATQNTKINKQVIQSMATSSNPQLKSLLLDELAYDIESGKISAGDSASIETLKTVVLEGLNSIDVTESSYTKILPDIKVKACRLLGAVGGDDAKNVLIELIKNEREPVVLAEAMRALGQLKITLSTYDFIIIANQIRTQDLKARDNYFASSVISCVESLYETGQVFNQPDFLRSLILIAEGNYLKSVREYAWTVIEMLID